MILREIVVGTGSIILFFYNFVLVTSQACDNNCNQHGKCEFGRCVCYDNWGLGMGREDGDCSERTCPFELSWGDRPNYLGKRHRYAECADKGVCNRETGECHCYEGYEGKGCQRQSCVNDCSGHGICKYIEDMLFGDVEFAYRHLGFDQQDGQEWTYRGWDKTKTRMCQCDPGYFENDCSKRMCPYGNDVLATRNNLEIAQLYQVQRLTFTGESSSYGGIDSRSFALTFQSKMNETFTTTPIVLDTSDLSTFSTRIRNALVKLPNRVIDDIAVQAAVDATTDTVFVDITFIGSDTEGNQHLLTVEDYACADGCTPRLDGLDMAQNTGNVTLSVPADFNSYECGRRGRCDYNTGICKCFAGYSGPSCSILSNLA